MLRVAQAQPLYDLLSGTLGLPVTWPLEHKPFASYAWISVGNTSLELWAAQDNADLPTTVSLPLVHGFALVPVQLDADIEELASRGLHCKTPRTYRSTNDAGADVPNFTNAVVLELAAPTCCIFYCDWSPDAPIAPWAKPTTTLERRLSERRALAQADGGTLGVERLAQIRLQTPDVAQAGRQWRALTGCDEGPILLQRDLLLTLEEGPLDLCTTLVFAVRSLPAARQALADRGLLGEPAELGDGEVALHNDASGGLDLRFTQE